MVNVINVGQLNCPLNARSPVMCNYYFNNLVDVLCKNVSMGVRLIGGSHRSSRFNQKRTPVETRLLDLQQKCISSPGIRVDSCHSDVYWIRGPSVKIGLLDLR